MTYTAEELLELGFTKAEGTNRFDYFANLLLYAEVPFEGEEGYEWGDISDEQIVELIHKRLANKVIVREQFDGFLRVSVIPNSGAFYLTIFWLGDYSYSDIDTYHSREIMRSVIEKGESSYERYNYHSNEDNKALTIVLKKLQTALSKEKNVDEIEYLKSKILSVQDMIAELNNSMRFDDETNHFEPHYGNNKCLIGCIDGYLMFCDIPQCVGSEPECGSYVELTEINGFSLLEIGPNTKKVFEFLLSVRDS